MYKKIKMGNQFYIRDCENLNIDLKHNIECKTHNIDVYIDEQCRHTYQLGQYINLSTPTHIINYATDYILDDIFKLPTKVINIDEIIEKSKNILKTYSEVIR